MVAERVRARVGARSGVRVRVWAPCVLARAVHRFVDHRVWHVQEGERRLGDKVVPAGVEQRERWHNEVMLTTAWPCHDVLGDGRGCSGDAMMSRGGARFQREAKVVKGTWSTLKFPAWAPFGLLPTRCSTKWPNEIYF